MLRRIGGITRCSKRKRNEIVYVTDCKMQKRGRRQPAIVEQRTRIACQKLKCVRLSGDVTHGNLVNIADERREDGARNLEREGSTGSKPVECDHFVASDE